MNGRAWVTAAVLVVATICTHTAGSLRLASSQITSAAVPAPEERVDINAASLDQLLKVPGMTRTWATRIIRHRPYRSKNELVDRGVVTTQMYDRIKDYIIAHRIKP